MTKELKIMRTGVVTKPLSDDGKLLLNNSGDTYFFYNNDTNILELWVNDIKVEEWGNE